MNYHISYKTIALLLALLAPVLLTACNTVEGLGEDIQAVGKTIDKKAEKNKPY